MEDLNEPGKFIIEDSVLDHLIYGSRIRNTVVPLWSVERNKEYLEFEIYAEEIHDDIENERYENERTELCSLCDVEVPVSFLEFHRNSEKHKANSIITQISLDRTRRHMLQTSPAHRPPRDNIYFCTACSCAVAVSKRTEHNTSETHKQSLLHDKMLNSLALIFETKENVKKVWEEQTVYRQIDRNEKGEELTISKIRNKEIRVEDDKNAIADKKIDRNEKEKEEFTISKGRNEEIRAKDDDNASPDVDKAMADNIAMFDADNAIANINHAINTVDTNKIVKESWSKQKLAIDTIIDEIARGTDKHEDMEAAYTDNAKINVYDAAAAKDEELKEATAKQASLTKYTKIDENAIVKYTGAIKKTKNVAKDITKNTTINKNAKIPDKRAIEKSVNVGKENVTNTIIDENAKKLFAGILNKSHKVKNNFDDNDFKQLSGESPQPSTSKDMTTVEYWMMMPNDDDDDVVQITTISGAVLTVKVDNYHGFYTVGDKTACRICKVVCDKSKHGQDPEHLNKVKLPILNKHCVRKIDLHWQHCIICNEIIENADAHAMCSEKHHTLLKKALIQDENTIQLASSKNLTDESSVNNVNFKNPIYFCYVCKVSTTLTKNEHNKTKEHKLNSISHSLHHHMKNRKKSSYVTCQVCQCNVPKAKIEINKHVKTQEHKYKHKKMMQENGLKYTDELTVFCSICSVYIPTLKEIMHIKDMRHINNKNIKTGSNEGEERQISVPSKTFYSLNANKKQFKPTAKANNKQVTQKAKENKKITQKDKNNKQITQKNKDNKQVTQKDGDTNKYTAEALYLLSNNIDDYNTTLFYCAICDVYFPKPALRKHVASDRHKRFFMNPKEIAEQAKEKEIILKKLPPEIVKTKIDSQFKCTLCQLVITASIKNINEHVKGSRHRKMMTDMEKSTSSACMQSTVDSGKNNDRAFTSDRDTQRYTTDIVCLESQLDIDLYEAAMITNGNTAQNSADSNDTVKLSAPTVFGSQLDVYLYKSDTMTRKINTSATEIKTYNTNKTSESYTKDTDAVASAKTSATTESSIKDNIQTTVKTIKTLKDLPPEIVKTEIDTELKCTLCQVFIPASIQNAKIHVEGLRHRKMKLREKSTSSALIQTTVASSKTSATTETSIKDNTQTTVKTIKTLKDLPPEIVKTEIDSEFKCTLCQIFIPATILNVEEHIKGTRHRKEKASSALMQSTEASEKNSAATETSIKGNIQTTVANGQTSEATGTSNDDDIKTIVATGKTSPDTGTSIVDNMPTTVASDKPSVSTVTNNENTKQTTAVSGKIKAATEACIKDKTRTTVVSDKTRPATETSIEDNIQTTVVAGTIISNNDDIQTTIATGKTSPDTGISIADNMPTTVASDKPSVPTETNNDGDIQTTVARGKTSPATETTIEDNIQTTIANDKPSVSTETHNENTKQTTAVSGKIKAATEACIKDKTRTTVVSGKTSPATETSIKDNIQTAVVTGTIISNENYIQTTIATGKTSPDTGISIADNMPTTVASDKPSVPTETNNDGDIQTTVTRGKTRAATEASIKDKTRTTVASGKISPATEISIEDNIKTTVTRSKTFIATGTSYKNNNTKTEHTHPVNTFNVLIQTTEASDKKTIDIYIIGNKYKCCQPKDPDTGIDQEIAQSNASNSETNIISEGNIQSTIASSNNSVATESSIKGNIQVTVASSKIGVLVDTSDENMIQTTLASSNNIVVTETNIEDKEQAIVASSKISIHADTSNENKIQTEAPGTINTNDDGIHTISEDQACAVVERTPQLLKEAEDSVDYAKDDTIEDSLSYDSEDYDDMTEIEERAKQFIVEYYINLKRAIRPLIETNDDDSGHVKCKLCDESVPNNLCTILHHTEGIKHINRYEALLLANSVKEDLYNYKCDVCKVIFARKNLFKHLNGERHEETTKVPSSEDMEHDIDDVFAALDRRRYLMKSIDLYTIKCELCNVVMQDEFEDLETHAKTRLHLLNYEGLMRENKISRNDDNLFCDFCEEDLDETDVLYHVNSNSHRTSITRTALLNKVNGSECPFCLISLPDTENDKKIHDKSIRHTFQKVKLEKMVAAAVDEMLKLRRENEFCNVYEEFKSKTADIDEHNASAKHKEKVQKLENERTGIITDSYSTISKLDVLDNPDDIHEHMSSTTHKDKIKANAGFKESTVAVKLKNAAHVTIEGFCNFCKDTPKLAYHVNEPRQAEHAESETTSLKDNKPTSGTNKLKVSNSKNTPKSKTDIDTCIYEPSTTARTNTEKLPTPSKSTQTDENKYTSRVFFCETCDATLIQSSANVLYHVRSVEKKTNTYSKDYFNQQNNNDGATHANLKLDIKMVDNEAETADLNGDNKANNEAELAASVTDNDTQNTQLRKTHRKPNKRVLPGIAEVTSDVIANDDAYTCDVTAHDGIKTGNVASNMCDVGKIEVQNPLFIKSHEDGAIHKKNVEKEKDPDLLDLGSLEDASGTGITNTNVHSGYLGSQLDGDLYNAAIITNNMKTDAQDGANDSNSALTSDKDPRRYTNDKIYLGSQLDMDLYEAAMITNGINTAQSANSKDKAKLNSPTVFGSQLDVYLYKADTMARNMNTSDSMTDRIKIYNTNVTSDSYTKDTDADDHFDTLRPWRPLMIPSRLGADTIRSDTNVGSDTDTKTDDTAIKTATVNEVFAGPSNEYSEIHKSGMDIDKEGKKDEKRFYTCKICALAILNNGTDIKNHLKTSIHEYNLNQQLKKIHEEIKERKYFCDICKINVSKSASDLNKHSESLKHKQMFKYTIQKNNIKIRADRVCFCELCDLYFNKQTVASHVMKDSHIKLLKEAKP